MNKGLPDIIIKNNKTTIFVITITLKLLFRKNIVKGSGKG